MMKNSVSSSGRKARRTLTLGVIILILLTTGCAGNTAPVLDSSGQAWVEYPHEGSTLPMAQVLLVVYAADPGGISYIHIKVNGQSLPAIAASPMTTDGSSRLVRVDYPWTPPTEGEYVVEAMGVNTAGASGSAGATRFCVVTCAPVSAPPSETEATPTPTPASIATSTELPFVTLPPLTIDPTATLTLVPPSAGFSVNFYASPPYINAGACTTLYWEVQGAESVYLGNTQVPATGSQGFCLCETTSYTLTSNLSDGTSDKQKVRVEVQGSCASPTNIPPADTSGPTINYFSTFWEGCSIYGQANITDPSGVTWAEFWYNLNGQGWVWIQMNQSGGGWISRVGIETGGFAGSIQYKIRTLDAYNNESWSGVSTYDFSYCGG